MLLLTAETFHQYLLHPNFFPTHTDFLTWCQNMDPISWAVLVFAGLSFLFSGFASHRFLVAMNGVVIGAYLGAGLALGMGFPMWAGAPVGAMLIGIVAWYLTAWSAAAFGAIAGAFLGASIWSMFGLAPNYAWSGAMTGAVTLGLLCFILFRISVILFTSLQGSVMLTLGVLGVAFQYPASREILDNSIASWPYILPGTILGLMMLGLGYQYMKGPGGKGGSGGKSSGSSGGSASEKPAPKEKKSKE